MKLANLLKHHRVLYTGDDQDYLKIVCICSWHSKKASPDEVWDEWIDHVIARANERKSELR